MDTTRLLARSNYYANHLAVFFFAAIVLLTETVLFHTARFVLDYMLATTVLGCAVLGIGLGAFGADHWPCRESHLFGWCCLGTTGCLYAAAYALLRHNNLFILLPAVASVFVFPSLFIARMFRRRDAAMIYFFDMLGAGTAVVLAVVAYRNWSSETIYLGIVTTVPMVGAVGTIIARFATRRGPSRSVPRFVAVAALLLLTIVGGMLLHQQIDTDAMNIVKLVDPDAPNIPAQSVLRRPSRFEITKTYDSLVGRIDAMPIRDSNRVFVTYDGFFNDNFRDIPPRDYLDFARPHELRFPSTDPRVVYGLVKEPRTFVIGPAATGILKTLREITPADHIEAVEINPGILQMMLHDFFDASGRAYEGLQVYEGNALSALQGSPRKYDLITLINTHSSRWIGALGAPDYLHTRESYDLYLDHLTEEGYLLFEERPDTDQGELGLRRMILTLCDCLRRRGAADPAEHFFVWEFMSNRFAKQGGTGIQPGSDMYYVAMIVSLQPLRGQRRQDIIDWCDLRWRIDLDARGQLVYNYFDWRLEPAYLKGVYGNSRFAPFFAMLDSGDFSPLGSDFDASLVTNDRPFPSCGTRSAAELSRLVRITGGIGLLLGILFSAGALRKSRSRKSVTLLVLYNLAIGGGYFLVEIMLIQATQNVLLSPSTSLVLVLGVLLLGSGCGGLLSRRFPTALATATLIPFLLLALWLPAWMVRLGWNQPTCYLLVAASVLLVGVNLGIYFPRGLRLAQSGSLRRIIPHLFALNSIAGSMATTVSFYLAVRVGYTWTVVLAVALYLIAAILDRIVRRGSPVT